MNEENKTPMQEEEEVKTNATTTPTVIEEDDDKSVKYMTPAEFERAKLRQNLPVGVIAGIIAGIVCASLWAAIAVWTNTIHTFMAILVGLGVGFVIRIAGKGVEAKFGIVGGIIAALSCALGNFLSTIGFIASNMNADFFDVLFNFDYSLMPMIMKESFEVIDLLFYGLAIIVGFGAAFHTVKIQED